MRKLLVVAVGLVAVGCAHPQSWTYQPAARAEAQPLIPQPVSVRRFTDRRSPENSVTMLWMLPVVPAATNVLRTPETATGWKFSPPEDFARAVAQELDAAQLFSESYYDERSTGTYLLTGEIDSTEYRGTLISYGLSVYASAMWLVGFPAAHTTNNIDVTLRLTRPPESQPMWTYRVQSKTAKTHWIYAMGSEFRYAEMLKAEMPAILASLRAALAPAH